MLREMARGLGLGAASSDSVGPTSDYKARIGYTTHGQIPLVAARGAQRWATYRQIYVTNPWVFSATNMLAQGLGRMPIGVYQNDTDGFPVRVRGDMSTPGRPSAAQSLDSLIQNGYVGSTPGQRMSRKAMITGTLIDRLVYGNALWIMSRDSQGNVIGLRRIRWRDVYRVEPDQDGWPLAYWWRPWNGFMYGPMQITSIKDAIHFGFGSDPEGLYGISPLESCRHTLALHDALVRHLIGYFKNSARPSGFMSIDKDITKDRAEEIREMIDGLYASPENAGKVFAAPGTTWQELGKAPDQSAIVDLIKLSREEISTAFAVPPPVLGILDNAIKSNIKELREQFGRDSLGPWAADFEAEFSAQLLPQQAGWRNLCIKFDLAELLRPDLEALALVIKDVSPHLTVDEIRTRYLAASPLNLPGLSDVPWAAARTAPLTSFPTEPVPPKDEPPTPSDDDANQGGQPGV